MFFPLPEVNIEEHDNIRFQEFLARFRRIKDQEAHFTLQNNLIDHMWKNIHLMLPYKM